MRRSTDELADLAIKLKSGQRKTHEQVLQQGEWLLRAKELCLQEGIEWLSWLESETGIARSTAAYCMKIARENRQGKSTMSNIGHGGQNRFDIFEQSTIAYAWLIRRRNSWPEQYRSEFALMVRTCIERMEAEDDAERRIRDGAAKAG